LPSLRNSPRSLWFAPTLSLICCNTLVLCAIMSRVYLSEDLRLCVYIKPFRHFFSECSCGCYSCGGVAVAWAPSSAFKTCMQSNPARRPPSSPINVEAFVQCPSLYVLWCFGAAVASLADQGARPPKGWLCYTRRRSSKVQGEKTWVPCFVRYWLLRISMNSVGRGVNGGRVCTRPLLPPPPPGAGHSNKCVEGDEVRDDDDDMCFAAHFFPDTGA